MSNQNNAGCSARCWVVAAIIGLLTLVILVAVAHYGWAASIFLGALTFVLLGLLFNWLFCSPVPSMATSARKAGVAATSAEIAQASKAPAASPAAAPVAAKAPEAKEAVAEPAAEAAEPVAEAKAEAEETASEAAEAVADTAETAAESVTDTAEGVMKPSTPLAGEAELASRKGSWKYEGSSDAKTETAPAAPAAAAPAAAVEETPDYDGDGVKEGENEGTKPAGLSAPRDGGADNLKEIKGVGPKLEQLLHSMGFYHFDQIANWSADEVAWVNANLKGFKGRVTRDNWIEQAKILASGGETEFSKRVEDGGVY